MPRSPTSAALRRIARAVLLTVAWLVVLGPLIEPIFRTVLDRPLEIRFGDCRLGYYDAADWHFVKRYPEQEQVAPAMWSYDGSAASVSSEHIQWHRRLRASHPSFEHRLFGLAYYHIPEIGSTGTRDVYRGMCTVVQVDGYLLSVPALLVCAIPFIPPILRRLRRRRRGFQVTTGAEHEEH